MTPELEELVKILVYQAARRYGYDPEDTLQEAQIIALQAVRTHDPKLGCLGKRIRFLITHRLDGSPTTKYWRLKSCVKNRVKKEFAEEQLESIPSRPQNQHFLTDLLDELSEDARAIISIVLDTPGSALRSEVRQGEGQWFLLRYLRKTGWEEHKIYNAINEIKEALA